MKVVSVRLVLMMFCVIQSLSVSYAAVPDSLMGSSVKIYSDNGTGSGVIVESTGVILTNFHVIDGAKSVAIELSDGEIFQEVALIVSDPRRDIAALKISGFDLPTSSFGNSNDVKVGDRVTVIGSPRGYIGTLSEGVISARRKMDGYELFQLDASISKGSSGGGVFDKKGKLIALAVGVIDGAQNLNFAVPINYARGLNMSNEPQFQFESGGGVINQTLLGKAGVSGDDLSNRLSITDFFDIVEDAAGRPYQSPPVEGDIAALKLETGTLRVFVEGEKFAIYSFWSTSDVELNEKLLTEWLHLNHDSDFVSISIDPEDDSVAVGLIGYIAGLDEGKLRGHVSSVTEMNIKLIAKVNEGSEKSDFLRSDVNQSPALARSRKVVLLDGAAEIRVPKSWKRKDKTLGSARALILEYLPLGGAFPILKIIAEPEVGNLTLDSLPNLLEVIWTQTNPEEDSERNVLASGTHVVAGIEFYWEHLGVSKEGFEFVAHYSVYAGPEGLVQFIALDLPGNESALEQLDVVLGQFKVNP